MKLYEIAASLERVLAEIEHEGGYLTQKLEERLNSLEMALSHKSEDCLKYIHNLEAQVESAEREIARLKVRKQTAERKIKSIKEYLLKCLGPSARVETSIGRIWFKESKKVEIDGEVPECYMRVTVTKEPNKEELMKDLRNPEVQIPGARLVSSYSLQVR